MSRGRNFARFNAGARSTLEADVGPVDDESCGVDPCDSDAVYRVPWPQFGGDIAYCPYHLARYRHQHPDLWERLQQAVDDELSALATRGDRFFTLNGVPGKLFDEEFVAIALLATGEALYEEVDPDDLVLYLTVDRSLEETSRTEVARDRAGEFLTDLEQDLGVHEWADDVEAALYGGEGN